MFVSITYSKIDFCLQYFGYLTLVTERAFLSWNMKTFRYQTAYIVIQIYFILKMFIENYKHMIWTIEQLMHIKLYLPRKNADLEKKNVELDFHCDSVSTLLIIKHTFCKVQCAMDFS